MQLGLIAQNINLAIQLCVVDCFGNHRTGSACGKTIAVGFGVNIVVFCRCCHKA